MSGGSARSVCAEVRVVVPFELADLEALIEARGQEGVIEATQITE
jgi:hypothetical protein